MTADRLDLDALEALANRLRRSPQGITYDADKGRATLDHSLSTLWPDEASRILTTWEDLPESLPELIAAARERDEAVRLYALRDAEHDRIEDDQEATIEAERKRADRSEAERDAAQAALDRVRALHVRDSIFRNSCAECSDFGTDMAPMGALIEWPCATFRAIATEGQEAGD